MINTFIKTYYFFINNIFSLCTLWLIAVLFLSCAATEKKVETVFYPSPPETPRLQFLVSITSEKDIGKKPGAFKEFIIGRQIDSNEIARPFDIGAVKGRIYISDKTLNKIIIMDLENKTFDFIKSEREGAIGETAGIWVTEDDHKYLADIKRRQVLVFDNNDKFLRAYGEKDQFSKPIDVAVYQDKIYVCDFDKHQIIVIDKTSGKTIQRIGDTGTAEERLYKPTHIIVDRLGNIYVNDSFNYRIQKFSSNGEFKKSFGYHGDTLGGFARPKGLAIDREGHLYVVDAAFENVQIFDDKTADPLLFFGGFGAGQGSMYLPTGIYIDYYNAEYFKEYVDKDFDVKYLVYIGNMLGDKKLNVYGFGKWIGAKLPEIKGKN